MPSLQSLSKLLLPAFSIAQSALGLSSPVQRLTGGPGASAVCNSPELSCHNSSSVENLCCFNSPGGLMLQTQFWDYDPATGPEDSWTIHGLWPDNCDGTYDANCDDRRAYTNLTAILQAAGNQDLLDYMNTYWPSYEGTSEIFWEHEWSKHGTCISTLDPDCYTDYQPTEEVPDFFSRTVALFKTLPSYDWLSAAGITPSTSQTYSSADIQAALSSNHDDNEVFFDCDTNGALNQIWYFFNVRGSVQTGDFIPTGLPPAPNKPVSHCPSDGIKYLPKSGSGGGPSPTSTASSSTAPSATPTGAPFSGRGYLNVITSGAQTGCIISGGTWYTTGTCAAFTASDDADGFTLQSSKGACGVVDGALTCGGDSSTFNSDGSDLSFDGSSTFYADAVPSGSQQATVYASEEGHDVSLTIEWQSI